MAEEAVPTFDPSLRKKKAKKVAAPEPAPEAEQKEAPAVEEKAPEEAPADELGFGKKKKTAKKAAEPEAAEAAPAAPAEAAAAPVAAAPAAPETATAATPAEAPKEGAAPAEAERVVQTSWPQDSDHEYTYQELAGRIFDILRKNNPEFGERSQVFLMKPPQIGREGKKTVWFNFQEMCRLMNRKLDHVKEFAFAELGTNGSLDANQRLVIRGRFQHKHIETIVRKYIKEYVTCNTCNTANTVLKKENRLTFVVCNGCGSSRSVTAIKKGFEAQITKRRLDKDKQK